MRRFAAVRSAGLWLGFVGIAALWLNAASAASTALSEGSITFEGEPPSLSEAELRFAATEPGVSAWNEEQAEAPDGSYVPDIAWHEHLAEKYGVSIEAAAQIGEWESTTMVQTTDALHNEFGDQVIQYRVSPPDFEIEVFTFLDESTIDEFVDTLSLPPPTVVTTTTNLVPAAAVNELRAQLLDVFRGADMVATVVVISNGMRVYADDPAGARSIVDLVDMPENLSVEVVPYEAVVNQTHIDPRGGWADRKTYGTPADACTLGFAATLADGTAGMVSAGHCPESTGTRRLATGPDYISSSSCLTLRRELQYYDDPDNPELDAQFLRDYPGTSGNCFGSFIDDVCASASFDDTSGSFDFWRCGLYSDLTGWSWTNPVGADVIFFGAIGVDGIQYGEIVDNLFPACIGCPGVYVHVHYTTDTSGGDSGGSVRIGSTLQGVHKGTFAGEEWRGVYSKAGYVNSYGMHPAISGPVGPNGS